MTNDQCAAFAQKNNAPLFGTEFSSQCYLGYALNTGSSALADSQCGMACAGNSSQNCGGASTLSLYNNTLYVPVHNPNPAVLPGGSVKYAYQGCYVEPAGARALGPNGTNTAYSIATAAMTVETCAAICFNKGYAYMGVEFASECYCNSGGPSNGATLALTGDAECNKVCNGEPTEWCGGTSRINIYKRSS